MPLECCNKFKEASYSRVPAGISLHVSIFPILAVQEIHFMVYRSGHKSNLSIRWPWKFPLHPMKPKELSSWEHVREDEILTIWDRLRQEDAHKSRNLLYLASLRNFTAGCSSKNTCSTHMQSRTLLPSAKMWYSYIPNIDNGKVGFQQA